MFPEFVRVNMFGVQVAEAGNDADLRGQDGDCGHRGVNVQSSKRAFDQRMEVLETQRQGSFWLPG